MVPVPPAYAASCGAHHLVHCAAEIVRTSVKRMGYSFRLVRKLLRQFIGLWSTFMHSQDAYCSLDTQECLCARHRVLVPDVRCGMHRDNGTSYMLSCSDTVQLGHRWRAVHQESADIIWAGLLQPTTQHSCTYLHKSM